MHGRLNSPGWKRAQVNDALIVLEDSSNDELVALIARAWTEEHGLDAFGSVFDVY